MSGEVLQVARYEIVFRGTVQGVGFRATTCRVARGHQVAGWVRNEPDGSVRCVAEGARGELDRFVAAVGEAMGGRIVATDVTEAAATGEFRGFDVEF